MLCLIPMPRIHPWLLSSWGRIVPNHGLQACSSLR
jgi:hypothetical protein